MSQEKAVTPPTCPECGGPGQLVPWGAIFQTKDWAGPEQFWVCAAGCDTRIGAHEDGTPTGTMAGPYLRWARMRAHELFSGARMTRWDGLPHRLAFAIMREQFGLTARHFGEMDRAQCDVVIAHLTPPATPPPVLIEYPPGFVGGTMRKRKKKKAKPAKGTLLPEPEPPNAPGPRAINLARRRKEE